MDFRINLKCITSKLKKQAFLMFLLRELKKSTRIEIAFPNNILYITSKLKNKRSSFYFFIKKAEGSTQIEIVFLNNLQCVTLNQNNKISYFFTKKISGRHIRRFRDKL